MTFVARHLPWFVVTAAAAYLVVVMMPPPQDERALHLYDWGTIAVQDGGRIKPIDTVARNQMMLISHRQRFVDTEDESHTATRFMLDVMTSLRDSKSKAQDYKVFRIENDQVLNVIGLEPRAGFRYSLNEIRDKRWQELVKENDRALAIQEKDPKELTLFDQKVLELSSQIRAYEMMATLKDLHMSPSDSAGERWDDFITALEKQLREENQSDTYAVLFAKSLKAYREGNLKAFNEAVADYHARFDEEHPAQARKVRFEAFFNHAEPFYHCSILYVCVFVLVCLAWLGIPLPLNRAAFWLAVFTLSIHVLSLVGRMYITERPLVFVTNLYSSAVFIGSMSVALCLVLECLYPLGIGNCLAGVLGFATLLIAHNLAASGDTMGVLLAVLDTNFWLATHVTMVTFGYAATYVAGFLGLMFAVFQLRMVVMRYRNGARDWPTKVVTFTLGLPVFLVLLLADALPQLLSGTALQAAPANTDLAHQLRLTPETIKLLGRLIYGVVCFATLLSFVGTVLGGIWADQSWGRFWGWDPKENGALIIVIWNALILHARWGGLVQSRGMAALAMGGNIVTTWSWFGVNMLGVGLHSYGFMEGAAFWVLAFIGLNLVMIGACLMPSFLWRDDASRPPALDSLPIKPSKRRKDNRPAPAGAITAPSPIYR